MRKIWKMVVTPAGRSGKERLHWHVAAAPQGTIGPRPASSQAPVEDGAAVALAHMSEPEFRARIACRFIEDYFRDLYGNSKLAHDRQLSQLFPENLAPLAVAGELEPKDLHS